MEVGLIGLGRMGANMVRSLTRDGHTCVGYARRPEVVEGWAMRLQFGGRLEKR